MLRFALVAHQRRAAFGAHGDVFERPAVGGTLREVYADDLRDDLAALLDVNHIARADVQLGHLFGVVQRGAPHGGSGEQHRFEVGHGRHGSRAPHLERHAVEARQGLFGLELISYGPFRGLGRESQLAPHGEVVDLDHHAVRREGEFAPRRVPMFDECVDLRGAAADARRIRDLEAPFAGLFQTLPVGREGQFVACQLVERAVQSAPGHHGRRLLLERPGGGVAGVGEELLAVGLALGVEAVERGVGHQDLAPDLEMVGPSLAPQAQGHRAHRAHVGRHVVALHAVAARHGTHEASVLVGERDGRAVEFQLAYVVRGAGLAFDAGDEFVQFVQRVGVAQRQHRVAVPDGLELRREVAADPHRRGIGIGEFGMRAFQFLKFAHHRVEFEVRDFGGVFDVILEVMQFELTAQLLDSFAYHNIRMTCVKLHILSLTTGKNRAKSKKMQKKIADVARYSNFAYNCKKFPSTFMANQTTAKKHIVTSFHNLTPEIQEAVKAKYPLGFTDAMIRVDKPNGDFFYAVPYDTDEIAYMVKVDVKVDDNSHDDDDKDYYDDEIKGADDIQGGDDDASDTDSSDDDVSI